MAKRTQAPVDRPKLGTLSLFLFPHLPLPSMDCWTVGDRRTPSGEGKQLHRHLQAPPFNAG